jgi:uncharacterized protein
MSKNIQSSFNIQRIGGVILISLALWYILDQFGALNFSPTVDNSAGLVAVFGIGLVASISSCTAILAGLILALSANHAKRHSSESSHDRLRPHVLFNLGRLLGFGVFGAIVGFVGSLLVLTPTFNAVFILFVAVMMIGIGVSLLELVPAGRFQFRPPKKLSKKILKLQDSDHPAVPFVLGALTFFLPCGFTQSMQLFALGTGSPVGAAVIMMVFALGTVPALFGIGAAASMTKGKMLKRLTQVAGVLVLVIGFSQFQNGMTLMGFTLPESSNAYSEVSEVSVNIVDGKQVIQMEVASAGFYSPDVLQVVEGVPVDWEIYGPKFMGCFDTIISRSLGISERLSPGNNVISFTPTRVGAHTFSCSMGMSRGTIVVTPNEE